jgi:hypothetical protein
MSVSDPGGKAPRAVVVRTARDKRIYINSGADGIGTARANHRPHIPKRADANTATHADVAATHPPLDASSNIAPDAPGMWHLGNVGVDRQDRRRDTRPTVRPRNANPNVTLESCAIAMP